MFPCRRDKLTDDLNPGPTGPSKKDLKPMTALVRTNDNASVSPTGVVARDVSDSFRSVTLPIPVAANDGEPTRQRPTLLVARRIRQRRRVAR